ncbi:MAG: 4'-phosphopantetheinyl transferase family protein [Ilumatobacteraceae bacterium]
MANPRGGTPGSAVGTAPDVDGIAAALRAIAPDEVVTGARAIHPDDVALLHPEEFAAVANAVDVRRSEFGSGRALLRLLLDEVGDASGLAILVGPTRAPLLPSDVRGSLAHDRAFVVAAVTRDPMVSALGIDVEPVDPLGPEMARAILRDDEAHIDPHLAFTLKEAAYKAWSNGGGRILEHHDVRLRLEGQRFEAVVLLTGRVYTGSWATVSGRHIALVVAHSAA